MMLKIQPTYKEQLRFRMKWSIETDILIIFNNNTIFIVENIFQKHAKKHILLTPNFWNVEQNVFFIYFKV